MKPKRSIPSQSATEHFFVICTVRAYIHVYSSSPFRNASSACSSSSNTHFVVISPILLGGRGPPYWNIGGGDRPPCPPSAAAPGGVDELKLVTGRLCAKDYVTLLGRALPASVRSLGLEGDYIFQQDNASCHSVKYTKDWMARNGITLLDWPAQSPDLNPIEHLWDALGRQLGCRAFSNNEEL